VEGSSWSSLEIVKLIVSALIPLAVVGVGYLVTRATKRLESVQWANQTVIHRRLDIFSEVAPKLNRLSNTDPDNTRRDNLPPQAFRFSEVRIIVRRIALTSATCIAD
jgi:hypothetical protein